MGCDIHAFLEYRKKDSKTWWAYSGELELNRNYTYFGLMASGVRSEYPESFLKRGEPTELSYMSNDKYEDSDYHSHSWLNAVEFNLVMQFYQRYAELNGWEQDITYTATNNLMQFFENNGYETRLVFCFDN